MPGVAAACTLAVGDSLVPMSPLLLQGHNLGHAQVGDRNTVRICGPASLAGTKKAAESLKALVQGASHGRGYRSRLGWDWKMHGGISFTRSYVLIMSLHRPAQGSAFDDGYANARGTPRICEGSARKLKSFVSPANTGVRTCSFKYGFKTRTSPCVCEQQ